RRPTRGEGCLDRALSAVRDDNGPYLRSGCPFDHAGADRLGRLLAGECPLELVGSHQHPRPDVRHRSCCCHHCPTRTSKSLISGRMKKPASSRSSSTPARSARSVCTSLRTRSLLPAGIVIGSL